MLLCNTKKITIMNKFLLFVFGICNPQFRNAVREIRQSRHVTVHYDTDTDDE
jgi:hypothetical protein